MHGQSNVYLSICDFKKSLVFIAPSWPTGLLFKQSRSGHLGQHHLWYFQIDFMPPLFDSNDIYYRAIGRFENPGGGASMQYSCFLTKRPQLEQILMICQNGGGGGICPPVPTALHQIICANHGESVKIDSIVWLRIFFLLFNSGNISFNATITYLHKEF